MSSPQRRQRTAVRSQAALFAALGDETRLSVLDTLSSGEPRSITRLTKGTRLTRQALTKHLRVLEEAGVVRSVRVGRESRYEIQPEALSPAHAWLDRMSGHWDEALARLKDFVER